MKKVLFIARFFFPHFGGGEFFIQNALDYMSGAGYDCFAACYADGSTARPFFQDRNIELGKIKVLQRRPDAPQSVSKVFDEVRPDVVITQSVGSTAFLNEAKKRGIPSVFGVHFYDEILSIKRGKWFQNVLTNPENFNIERERQAVFHLADKFFVNSDYMLEVVRKYVGKEPDAVIYPPINIEKTKIVTHYPTHITFVNPNIGKGMGVFHKLAQRMPEHKFRIVGQLVDLSIDNAQTYLHLKKMKNVEVVGQVDNMSQVYESTKILLVPSLVDESFSMVTLEAMRNGIPVLGSTSGNLPYLLRDGGGYVLDTNDIDQWQKKITTICKDSVEYERLQKEAYESCKKYDSNAQCRKLVGMIEFI